MIADFAAWFKAGGPFMWGILTVLGTAVAIILERLIFYYAICGKRGSVLYKLLTKEIENNNLDNARKIVAKGWSPIDGLLRTAVEAYADGCRSEQIREAVEEVAIKEMPRLTNRLNYLGLFANVSTLMGLLGTVMGLQVSFGSLAAVEAAKKATMLASGIAQAMNATAFGLVAALTAMICYTFLFNRQARIAKDIDQTVVRMLNYLKTKRP